MWVFESSQHQFNAPKNEYFDEWRGIFNWTMTYREDSDVHMPSEYLNYFPTARKASNSELLDDVSKKTKFAAWFVTNRNVKHRNRLVDQLKEFVQVDIFGPEESFHCPKSQWLECVRGVVHQYLFYLAFENAFVKDYITEKVYTYIGLPIVPVVYGGGNYKRYLPPNSYIDATEFASAKELADFLTKVASDTDLYIKYFDWQLYGVWQKIKPRWCPLCQKMIMRSETETKTYEDIYEWFYDDTTLIDADKNGVPGRAQIDKAFDYSGTFDMNKVHEFPINF